MKERQVAVTTRLALELERLKASAPDDPSALMFGVGQRQAKLHSSANQGRIEERPISRPPSLFRVPDYAESSRTTFVLSQKLGATGQMKGRMTRHSFVVTIDC